MIGPAGFGNGYCLPAGPLREPVSRLKEVDFIINNSSSLPLSYAMHYTMAIEYGKLVNVATQEEVDGQVLQGKKVHGVAAVGDPSAFFGYLESRGCDLTRHTYPDHYQFQTNEFEDYLDDMIVMTEKDATKFEQSKQVNLWYVPINIAVSKEFDRNFLDNLN